MSADADESVRLGNLDGRRFHRTKVRCAGCKSLAAGHTVDGDLNSALGNSAGQQVTGHNNAAGGVLAGTNVKAHPTSPSATTPVAT